MTEIEQLRARCSELEARLEEIGNQEPVAWPVMGYGRVAIGGGLQPNGMSCLLYMDMGETREIDTDTIDLFPIGSVADPGKTLAAIYFKNGKAIQQTIDVLREMQAEIGYTHASDSAARIADLEAENAELRAEVERLKNENHEIIARFQNENCGKAFMGEPLIEERPVPAKQYLAAVNGRREFRLRVIELRQQLAASQARELQLLGALDYVKLHNTVVGSLLMGAHSECPNTWRGYYDDALNHSDYIAKRLELSSQPSDTTALEALIRRAGEVMLERAAAASEELRHPDGYSGETVDWCQGTQNSADAIRALPAVTLDDLIGAE